MHWSKWTSGCLVNLLNMIPCTQVSIHSVVCSCVPAQAEGEIRRDRSQPVGYSGFSEPLCGVVTSDDTRRTT
eukprot:3005197-Pyramimonas_sp.AAC.1